MYSFFKTYFIAQLFYKYTQTHTS